MSETRKTADYFSHQDKAKKMGFLYLVSFGLVVLVTVTAIYLIGAGLMIILSRSDVSQTGIFGQPPTVWRLGPFLTATTILASVIIAVSWMKVKALQNNDGVYELARLLDGKLLDSGQASFDERRLINIVEEMSVAAGLPCPDVLVFTSQLSINAFAAGFTPQQAVVAFTQGAVDRLDREELQAVAAHEFGHILSGDMRLNMYLAGWLYGLLALPIAGQLLLRSRHGVLMGLGVVLWGLGKLGHLGAQLMQAAISRQREYLADSRGAQFTRNPEALARALRKIGGLAGGGTINSPAVMMFQHMFIASPMKSLFTSHPSLDSRIARLYPAWDGTYLDAPLKPYAQKREEERQARRKEALSAQAAARIQERLGREALKRKKDLLLNNPLAPITGIVGAIWPENLAAAASLLESWPKSLRRAAEDPLKATAVVAAAFLDSQSLDRQLRVVRPLFGEAWTNQIQAWHRELEAAEPHSRLPLLDVAAPALKRLNEADQKRLLNMAQALAGERLSLFTFAALEVLKNILGGPARVQAGAITSIREVRSECETVLNFLAWQGHPGNREQAAQAFQTGAGAFKCSIGSKGLGPEEESQLAALAPALAVLARTTPQIKKTILNAAFLCIDNDLTITGTEYETLKALGAALDYPLPLMAPTAKNDWPGWSQGESPAAAADQPAN